MHKVGHVIVQKGERDSILSTDRLADNDLVNVVKFVPVLISEINFRRNFVLMLNNSCQEAMKTV